MSETTETTTVAETTTTTTVATTSGVTVADMQEYLSVDEQDNLLATLISMAEVDVISKIDDSIDVSVYRANALFNQAVRTLVDFTYNNRGGLSDSELAYPPAYLYFINSIKYRIKSEVDDATES
ncbi:MULTISPECIES: head-tail connector protein [Lactiplantibacillus]|nr:MULTISPECIES: head-tail connector protein [Lactiplantibacillus]MBQ0836230.1 head-tail connector protein [Lactiplantibacillus pentosus]MBU7449019.1 head-tail connector protein [Lactiplantibacillus sp. 7.2.4]MBU7463130.1 head-tail connector protein [Lactiplantibacillus pentosus]MBU7481606.1 head-tail connector protein [Lactiplantibacillus pentosus]MBU7489250.1 head-tail connector protein [Lactiplantibacillus pentosus]